MIFVFYKFFYWIKSQIKNCKYLQLQKKNAEIREQVGIVFQVRCISIIEDTLNFNCKSLAVRISFNSNNYRGQSSSQKIPFHRMMACWVRFASNNDSNTWPDSNICIFTQPSGTKHTNNPSSWILMLHSKQGAITSSRAKAQPSNHHRIELR